MPVNGLHPLLCDKHNTTASISSQFKYVSDSQTAALNLKINKNSDNIGKYTKNHYFCIDNKVKAFTKFYPVMKFYRFILCISCSMLLLNGCQNDVYNPKAVGEDYFIQGIPADFDWATVASVRLEAIPYDQYNGRYDYKIEVFNKNPLTDGSAALYATGWCTAQQPLQKDIIVPDADTLVYICQTTPGGRKSVMPVKIENRQIICNFNPQNLTVSTNRSRTRTAAGDTPVPEVYPENAIEITQNSHELKSGNNYVIKNYTGELKFSGTKNLSIYVAGIWNNTASESKLEDQTNIYILPNGKLLSAEDWKITVNSTSDFCIARGGQLGDKEDDDISFQINRGKFLNEGVVYIDDMQIHSADFSLVNRGEFHMEDLKAGNAVLIENADQGSFYADEVNIQDATFNNQCYAEIEELTLRSRATVNIASGCALKCEKLKGEAWDTYLTLHDRSMIEITDKAEIEGKMTISGGEKSFSLFKTKKFESKGWQTVQFKNNLYVEWEKAEIESNSCTFIPPARLSNSNESQIDIPASKCSMGNDYKPEDPGPSQFPQEITYNDPYTYASEDNFPSPGDYDMNDLVVSLDSLSYYFVQKDQIERMTLHLTLRAVGATRQLGAAIQLDNLNAEDIKAVTYSKDLPAGHFNLNANKTEQKQKHAVIPLFDNAHKVLGYENTTTFINTINGGPIADPYAFDVTLEFNAAIGEADIRLDKLNYFTIVGTKLPRTEIHLPGYEHTSLSVTPKELQMVTTQYMWNILVPGYFRYPQEWKMIKNVYLQFEEWVKTGGQGNKNWYESPEESLLYDQK